MYLLGSSVSWGHASNYQEFRGTYCPFSLLTLSQNGDMSFIYTRRIASRNGEKGTMTKGCCYCSCQWGESVSKLRPPTGNCSSPPQVICDYGEPRRNDNDIVKLKNSDINLPQCHCPPQIPHGLTWVLTQASTVRGRHLAAWAMARPRGRWLRQLFLCDKQYSDPEGPIQYVFFAST
jgi:hypothetical protein